MCYAFPVWMHLSARRKGDGRTKASNEIGGEREDGGTGRGESRGEWAAFAVPTALVGGVALSAAGLYTTLASGGRADGELYFVHISS